MLDNLISYFEPNQNVLGLLLFGSLSQTKFNHDEWSDLDILVVVKEGKINEFFPAIDWITSFGKLYTYSQSADDFKCTTRVCFENFNRIDFVITSEGKLAEMNKWSSLPFSPAAQVIFSRSEMIDEIVRQGFVENPLSAPTQEQFLELVRDFRFKSMLAVYKVVRKDLLIALHLAFDLVRDCSVLGMLLRDRATGTNIHKQGGLGNEIVTQLEATQKPFTSSGILDSIKASNEVFEKLAHEWSDRYQESRHLLFDWIEKAKAELRS